MHRAVKAIALATLVCGIAPAPASAAEAEKPQPSNPGEQIKDGFIKIGHGIRDGAKRAWGAVKSAVGGDSDTAKKHN